MKRKLLYVTCIFIALVIFCLSNSFSAQWLPKNGWRLVYVDSQELVGENGAATNAFDGNPNTIWHTQYRSASPQPPHEIQIDLGQIYSIEGFRYLPRQDGGINGRIGQYEFYVSMDGINWGSPVAYGTFANSATGKEIAWDPQTGRFIRLRALTEVNGNPWTSMAEIDVLGDPPSGNQPPNGVIDSPSGNLTINGGDQVSFSGTGSDPDGDLPLSFHWSFGAGSGISDSTLEDPGTVRFNNPGTYTVTLAVTDALGNADPSPATRVITVMSPDTVYTIIPHTGWTLRYVDSQELVGENGAATNAFDGNPNTIWHTQYRSASPRPPHEIQIDLGQIYSIEGFRYLPRQDGGTNGRIGQYEFYVSVDGANWGSPVATGTFANNATEKQVTWAPQSGRFIRLRALTEVYSNAWTSMAEINVLGDLPSGNQSPNGVIDSPSANMTINGGDQVTFAGSGNDPDGDLPLSFHWSFGAGSGISDSTSEDPGAVRFNNPGTYTVTLIVTDALGNADPSPATRVITVRSSTFEVTPDWTYISQSPLTLFEPTVINPVLTARDVTDMTANYVADPFLFYNAGIWYMFFEVYSATSGGQIALATSQDGLHWTYDRIVLRENFHLSYPSVLRYNGRYFLIPESYMANEVRVYEAMNFPYDWQYSATLLSGHDFVDPSVFYYNNTWWMFVSDTSNRNCYLYYSDDLLSGWVEHPMSPIVRNDASRARPAGRCFVFSGNRVIRVAQKCDGVYGEQVRAFEVDRLTRTEYTEHEIPGSPILAPSGSGWNAYGMHHLDPWWTGSDWIASVDGWNGSAWSIGIRVSTAPPAPAGVIPHTGWTLRYADSQELVGENGTATNAFDGNPNTIWHTQWLTANPRPPHEIQIDLGQIYSIEGFRYLPRQDGSPNGRIGQYEFYVSMDGANWGSPVVMGTFVNNAAEKEVDWASQTGRFIRLRALTEVNGNPWTSAAEINIIGH